MNRKAAKGLIRKDQKQRKEVYERKENKNDNVNDVNGKRDNKKAAGKFKNWTTALSMELREHKSSAIVYFTLRALVIIMLVLQLLNRNYENVFLCILTLLLLVIPSLAQITFKVELPTALEIIILVFIFRQRYSARSVNFILYFRSGIQCYIH